MSVVHGMRGRYRGLTDERPIVVDKDWASVTRYVRYCLSTSNFVVYPLLSGLVALAPGDEMVVIRSVL